MFASAYVYWGTNGIIVRKAERRLDRTGSWTRGNGRPSRVDAVTDERQHGIGGSETEPRRPRCPTRGKVETMEDSLTIEIVGDRKGHFHAACVARVHSRGDLIGRRRARGRSPPSSSSRPTAHARSKRSLTSQRRSAACGSIELDDTSEGMLSAVRGVSSSSIREMSLSFR